MFEANEALNHYTRNNVQQHFREHPLSTDEAMRMKRNWATLAGLVKELRAHTFYWPPYQARDWLSFAIGRHDTVTSYPDLTAERKLRHFKTRIFFSVNAAPHRVESKRRVHRTLELYFLPILYCVVPAFPPRGSDLV